MAKKLTIVKEDATGTLSCDVLFQVLSRLPPKSLVRFRRVSKQWRNFISYPFFAAIHYNQSKNKKPLMVQVIPVGSGSGCFEVTLNDPLNTFSIKEFSLNFERGHYYIMYCSGLLLFYGWNHYCVCNPSTRDCYTANHYLHNESGKNYSPSRSDGAGFGFLPSTSEHKFVVLSFTPSSAYTHIASVVITLPSKRGVGSTKYMPVGCLDHENDLERFSDEATCVSGIIFWSIRRCHNLSMDLREFLAFDLESEVFRVITCPLHYKSYSDYYLVDFEGEVCLVGKLSGRTVIQLWVLKDHKNEIWAQIYTIDYSHFDRVWSRTPWNHEVTKRLAPLQIVDDNDGDKAILIKSYNGIFYYYNLEAKTFTKMGGYGECRGQVFVHHESLFHVPSRRLVRQGQTGAFLHLSCTYSWPPF